MLLRRAGISILEKGGHFYFGLTTKCDCLSTQPLDNEFYSKLHLILLFICECMKNMATKFAVIAAPVDNYSHIMFDARVFTGEPLEPKFSMCRFSVSKQKWVETRTKFSPLSLESIKSQLSYPMFDKYEDAKQKIKSSVTMILLQFKLEDLRSCCAILELSVEENVSTKINGVYLADVKTISEDRPEYFLKLDKPFELDIPNHELDIPNQKNRKLTF